MKSLLFLIALLGMQSAWSGSFHLFCEHQYVDQNSDEIYEHHFLSVVFSHNEPYSRDCSGVRLAQIERKFRKHLTFVDSNVDLYDGFTTCNCYSSRRDARKAHKDAIRIVRDTEGTSLRIIRDFFGK